MHLHFNICLLELYTPFLTVTLPCRMLTINVYSGLYIHNIWWLNTLQLCCILVWMWKLLLLCLFYYLYIHCSNCCDVVVKENIAVHSWDPAVSYWATLVALLSYHLTVTIQVELPSTTNFVHIGIIIRSFTELSSKVYPKRISKDIPLTCIIPIDMTMCRLVKLDALWFP